MLPFEVGFPDSCTTRSIQADFAIFQVNALVWYWDGASRVVRGTVVAIERLADGTQLLVIERATGGRVSLPYVTCPYRISGYSLVSQS
ncbi:hypothetical protein K525DRAFT_204101 [Schizophyllum commune Loenen D]|nr:hypothetical protein K525DRAFT_204101 [Schizophyllum commune Loenen D]